jgi:hypothetical protein
MIFYEEPIAWIIMGISIIIALAAQAGVKSAYAKYSKIRASSDMTGAQVARMMVENTGVSVVEHHGGKLSDHFDPRKKMIALSPEVFNGSTIAAFGIAAHEAGHALQHDNGYMPIKIRNGLILPLAKIGSTLSMPLVMIGLFAAIPLLIDLGILFFTAALLFQVITLPVEFNASRRAVSLLAGNSFLTPAELKGAKKVLNAAAMTYVAAVVTSLLQLLRLLMIARGRRR